MYILQNDREYIIYRMYSDFVFKGREKRCKFGYDDVVQIVTARYQEKKMQKNTKAQMKIQKILYAGVNAVTENCILPSHFYEHLINLVKYVSTLFSCL